MRIALVVERFEPAGGGVERVVWRVAHGLAEAGDEVHVIAARAIDSPAIRLRRVSVPTFWQPLRVAAFTRVVTGIVRQHRFDVVHSFSRTLRQDVFHAGGGCHAEYMRSTYGPAGAAARRLSPRHALLLEIERRIFADPGQIVQCVSGMVRDEIASRYGVTPQRLPVVPNAVDAERFAPEPHAHARLEERAHLRASDATVWLLAGSGWRRKGLDTAMRALAQARDPDAQLWVAGHDTVEPWLRLADRLGVTDRVRFLGARTDLERVYAAADGLLLPTRYDAFGLVCLEAAAAGLPIVVSGRAGAAELFDTGAVVVDDAENVAGFARAIDELADPAMRSALGEDGRRIAQAHGWKPHVEALRALYAQVRR